MRLLALDTTARAGSVALAIDGHIVEARRGDSSRTHGERLPGEILDLLSRHALQPAGIDVYAVAAGPGSFTGLRVGIACIQGFALANARPVVPVSAFEALEHIARNDAGDAFTFAWIDAQRGEVFGALYRHGSMIDAPIVAPPESVIEAWWPRVLTSPVLAIGDGAARYVDLLRTTVGDQLRTFDPLDPVLAPAIAKIASARADAGQTIAPHAIVPIYVRRPDAELAKLQKHGDR
jgi:tRNA threonylcarbamoyladenosine biosynthesis protein TsaB